MCSLEITIAWKIKIWDIAEIWQQNFRKYFWIFTILLKTNFYSSKICKWQFIIYFFPVSSIKILAVEIFNLSYSYPIHINTKPYINTVCLNWWTNQSLDKRSILKAWIEILLKSSGNHCENFLKNLNKRKGKTERKKTFSTKNHKKRKNIQCKR